MMSKILISMLERENESLKDSLRTAEQERDQYKNLAEQRLLQAEQMARMFDEKVAKLNSELQEAAQLLGEMQVAEHQKHLELESLRAKIKEAQEPVASRRKDFMGNWVYRNEDILGNQPLYAAPVIPD